MGREKEGFEGIPDTRKNPERINKLRDSVRVAARLALAGMAGAFADHEASGAASASQRVEHAEVQSASQVVVNGEVLPPLGKITVPPGGCISIVPTDTRQSFAVVANDQGELNTEVRQQDGAFLLDVPPECPPGVMFTVYTGTQVPLTPQNATAYLVEVAEPPEMEVAPGQLSPAPAAPAASPRELQITLGEEVEAGPGFMAIAQINPVTGDEVQPNNRRLLTFRADSSDGQVVLDGQTIRMTLKPEMELPAGTYRAVFMNPSVLPFAVSKQTGKGLSHPDDKIWMFTVGGQAGDPLPPAWIIHKAAGESRSGSSIPAEPTLSVMNSPEATAWEEQTGLRLTADWQLLPVERSSQAREE